MDSRTFLRSINIALDVEEPARLEHFRPTSKSANLIEQVLGAGRDRALLVVAPYGSGKSLTAGYLLHAVQNEPERFSGGEKLLSSVSSRVGAVDAELSVTLERRRESNEKGVGASLHGHYADTVGALRRALIEGFGRAGLGREARALAAHDGDDSETAASLVETAADKLVQSGRDHLFIVWDEFGRHLEALVAEGRPGELLALQVLAEAASRTKGVRVTLVLLLHRSFMGYAAGLPAGVRQEWSKIEGRFRVLQFVDDSLEMHRLLSGVVRELRPDRSSPPDPLTATAQQLLEAGYFPGVPSEDLANMLADAWPLEPSTLWLLPRVSARVAQHERTAFSFLHSLDLTAPVGPAALFDYFRGDFQADAGPGGTHRSWLEVESAIAKVGEDTLEARTLKAAFLLGLGLSGEKSKTTRSQLEFVAAGPGGNMNATRAAVDGLLERKLLIHRKQTDQILVWHGTDVDLRGRLEEERHRMETSFDLAPFLSRESPPPVWRPLRHNSELGVPRYFEGRYLTPSGLAVYLDDLSLGIRKPGTDGEVLYVLPADEGERKTALSAARAVSDPRVFIVVPKATELLLTTALDLAALLRMHQDHDLLSQDPMVRSELDLLTDDVRQALRPAVDRILYPGSSAAEWFHLGRPLPLEGEVSLQATFSAIMEEVYPSTPRILSEMVVRRRPTSVVINARKKVILGILERYGQESLGIEGDFADKAIFRSVFLRTGLYRQDGNRWRFATPNEIEDPGLSEVWNRVHGFFTVPGSKSVQSLVNELLEPPYGIREGLIPLLFAAGLKAFPAPKALRAKAAFLTDLLPSTIEEICRSPEDYVVDVVALSEAEEEYLQANLAAFAAWSPAESGAGDDLIRRTFDAMQGWWTALPAAARTSPALSKPTRKFRLIVAEPDPVAVLLRELPSAFGGKPRDLDLTFRTVQKCVAELEGMHDRFVSLARAALAQALEGRGIVASGDVRHAGQAWAGFFPRDLPLPALSPIARSTLLQLRRDHDSDEALLNALALLVTGHAFKDWNETVVPEFERRLRTALEDIEHVALQAGLEQGKDSSVTAGLVGLAQARLRLALIQLAALAGETEALDLVDNEITALWVTSSKDQP